MHVGLPACQLSYLCVCVCLPVCLSACLSKEDSHSVPLESGSRISEANLDDLDREQYGSLLSVSWLSATVEPGDCLYIPNR